MNPPHPPVECDSSGSLGDFVVCRDELRTIPSLLRQHTTTTATTMNPTEPQPEYFLTIEWNERTIMIIFTLLALCMPVIIDIIRETKNRIDEQGHRTGSKVPWYLLIYYYIHPFWTIAFKLSLLLYVATRIEKSYLQAHYQHLGHPPLYGEYPPLHPLMLGWQMASIIRLLMNSYNNMKSTIDALYMWSLYIDLVDRFLCVWIFENPTCLFRIITDAICSIISTVFFGHLDQIMVMFYSMSCYTVVNLIHMTVYLWRGKTNSINLTEQVTTNWFQVPDSYQAFAMYQIGVLAVQWVLFYIAYRSSIKQTTLNNNNNNNTKQE